MRFWDSSAIVPLVVEEPANVACRRLPRRDSRQLVWVYSGTEVLSAICRQVRTGNLLAADLRRATDRLAKLSERWTEVDAPLPVRERAEKLLRVHPLTAADSLQLGAALLAFDDRRGRRVFVSLDAALAAAAEREGFDAVAPGQ